MEAHWPLRSFWRTARSKTLDKAQLKAFLVEWTPSTPRCGPTPVQGSVQGAAQLLALNGWTRTVPRQEP